MQQASRQGGFFVVFTGTPQFHQHFPIIVYAAHITCRLYNSKFRFVFFFVVACLPAYMQLSHPLIICGNFLLARISVILRILSISRIYFVRRAQIVNSSKISTLFTSTVYFQFL